MSKQFPAICLDEPFLSYYNRFSGQVTKLATFAISASKHGGQLLNEFFIYWDGISPSSQY